MDPIYSFHGAWGKACELENYDKEAWKRYQAQGEKLRVPTMFAGRTLSQWFKVVGQ